MCNSAWQFGEGWIGIVLGVDGWTWETCWDGAPLQLRSGRVLEAGGDAARISSAMQLLFILALETECECLAS